MAGQLHAAVGHGRVDHLVGVDPHRPDAQRPARAVRARRGPWSTRRRRGRSRRRWRWRRPPPRVEKRSTRHHGAEDLLLGDPHVVADAVKTVGSWKNPRSPWRVAAEHELGALVLADGHVPLDALELVGRDDRAHLARRIEAGAEPQVPRDRRRSCRRTRRGCSRARAPACRTCRPGPRRPTPPSSPWPRPPRGRRRGTR